MYFKVALPFDKLCSLVYRQAIITFSQ